MNPRIVSAAMFIINLARCFGFAFFVICTAELTIALMDGYEFKRMNGFSGFTIFCLICAAHMIFFAERKLPNERDTSKEPEK